MKRIVILTALLLAFEIFVPRQQPVQDITDHVDPQVLIQQAEAQTWYQKVVQTNYIVNTYKVDASFAQQVVDLTHKYGDDEFPRANDLLAIIGIESSFRPTVKSNLKRDKAYGLTQIRPLAWKHLIKPGELTSIENQIKYAAVILQHNYSVLGDIEAAVNAYNVGIKAHKRGDRNNTYVARFNAFRKII